MTWVAYTARCREISVWHEHYIEPLGGVTQERLDALFNAKFQMGPWSVWVEIQRLMEASIPQSCGEGKHTFRDGLTTCAKCPETRVDESVVS
jgi:hypothetical protein